MSAMGLDLLRLVASIRFVPSFIVSSVKILFSSRSGWRLTWFPILSDRYMPAGNTQGLYFNQDLYFARAIYKVKPTEHLDVGSRIDGFVGSLLSFMDVIVADIRPLHSDVVGLNFIQGDLMKKDFLSQRKFDSISCLHTLEHFGLGRYGDKVNLEGWKNGFAGLSNLLNRDGLLYFSVPIGRQRIEFNAHRVFYPETIINEAISLNLSLEKFEFFDDNMDLKTGIDYDFNQVSYGCGLFIFRKIK